MLRAGSCFCGALGYEIAGPLGPVASCHCAFCRRIHGAAFTTVALVASEAISWLPSSSEPSRFTTPLGSVRHFCGQCASPLWNQTPNAGLAAVVVFSLVDGDQPLPWMHVNIESKAPWSTLRDGLPQFVGWPAAEALERLLQKHPGSWRPHQLLGPAA